MRKNGSIYLHREYHTTDQFIVSTIFGVQYMHYCVVLLCEVYSRTSTNGHLFTTATFFCPGEQSIHYLLFKPLYNCQLSTTAKASFFSDWRKSQEYSRNLNCMARWWFTRRSHFDCAPFIHTAAVSINCPSTILIALRTLYVFSCWPFDSKHYFSNFFSLYFISIYIYVGYPLAGKW